MKKSKRKNKKFKRYIRKQIKKALNKAEPKFCLRLTPNIDYPQNIHNMDLKNLPKHKHFNSVGL